MRSIPLDQLRDAVVRGVISEAQYEAILALGAATLDAAPLGPPTTDRSPSPEAIKGFNWISVAYFSGALLILFAFGWFLVDQWEALGPTGVLVVALFYATFFLSVGWTLIHRGFRVAGGLAVTAAVGMTPLATWAVESLLGVWTPWRMYVPFEGGARSWEMGRWAVMALATLASALRALVWTRFPFLVAIIAVSLGALVLPVAELLYGNDLGSRMTPWVSLTFGTAAIAVAYAVDGRDVGRAGYAFWLYLFGLIASTVGVQHAWITFPATRHLLPAVAILVIAASLYLRRRAFLVFGALALFWYLGWLAFEVFREAAAFPIVLATFGIAVILITVWLQRTYPRLVERVNSGSADSRPSIPGGYVTMLAPAVIAVALLLTVYPIERSRHERDRQMQERAEEEMRGQREQPHRRAR